MVLRISRTRIVSRPVDSVETISPDVTFIAIDTYVETSRKDEFIIGNLYDYNGNKISYNWDSAKQQVASLRGKNLNSETVILANEFLKNLYIKPTSNIDVRELSSQIINSLQQTATAQKPKEFASQIKVNYEESDDEELSYIDDGPPVFTSEFLEDDEEEDDFDDQLALKSQEFLKEHPELKTEMEIVRLLEGN